MHLMIRCLMRSRLLLQYFKQLECPLPESVPFETRCLWLLRLAVAKDYEDNSAELGSCIESRVSCMPL